MRKRTPLSDDFFVREERMVAVLGNVDSSKSTLVGILTNKELTPYIPDIVENESKIPEYILDDGNGKARSNILQFIHEQISGRTSSITYNYMIFESQDRVVNFVDLAGHENYLKTTIGGISSSYPDYGLLCIAKSVTKMTKEHMQLLVILDIPFAVILSKIDQTPEIKLKEILRRISHLLKSVNKAYAIVRSANDMARCDGYMTIPIFLLSNKSGYGLSYIIKHMSQIPAQEQRVMPNAFVVDNKYNITGFGLVVSGMSGIHIEKNMELYIGPFDADEFVAVKVRTLHDDYRRFVNELVPNKRGCLCFKIDNYYKKRIRGGMVLVRHPNDVKVSRHFNAEITVFNGHHTTIKPGYAAYINCAVIRGAIRFTKICKSSSVTPEYIRSGDRSDATIEFLKNSYCIMPGEKFVFREGRSIGMGIIID